MTSIPAGSSPSRSSAAGGPPHVLLLGFGAIGRHLATLFAPEREAGLIRMCAAEREVSAHRDRAIPGVELSTTGSDTDCPTWDEALARADLVVECAGVAAAREYGPGVIAAGIDLVLTSVGALADPGTARELLAGPGRLWVTSGAIGGFDVLGAAADADGLDTVRIRTAKLAASLIRPWMSEEQAARLNALQPEDEPVTVFSGGPAEAIEKFPANVNVAVALAWATRGRAPAVAPAATPVVTSVVTPADGDRAGAGDRAGVGPQGTDAGALGEAELLRHSLDRVRVELVADPRAERSRHEVLAEGPAGRFELTFESAPSPENPKTSGLTALAVARTMREALRLT